MAKKKKNYNLLLYELQQEAVRNAAITGGKVSNSALEKQAQDEYLAPINSKRLAKNAAENTERKKKQEIITQAKENTKKSTSSNKTTTSKKSTKEEEKRTWFSKGAFSDGYDFGDITKTILGTAGDIGLGAAKGLYSMGEGVADLVNYGIAGVEDLLGNDYRADVIRKKAMESSADKVFAPLEKDIDPISVIGEKGDSISQGLGYVGGIMLTGGLGASAGLGTAGVTALTTGLTGFSSMGSGMGEAYQGGATDEEALKYGIIAGVAEAGSELIFGGLGKAVNAVGLSKGLSSLDDALAKKISSMISSTVGKNIAEYTVKSSAEGVEEIISGIAQGIGKKMTYMSDEDLVQILKDENLLEQFVVGAVTSSIAQAPGLVKTTSEGKPFISDYKQDNQAQVEGLQQEIAKKTEELNQSQDAREKQIIQETINGLNEELNELTNAQQITDEKELKKQNFTYQAQENDSDIKKAVYESASKVMNNTTTTHKFVDVVAKIAEERGTVYEFTNTEEIKKGNHNVGDNIIDGFVQDGKVKINVDSPKFLNIILGHETTHLLEGKNELTGEYSKEYKALKQIAIDFAKSKGDYEARIEKLTKLYEGTNADIEAELTSDIVGEYLFTDENFVKELSIKQPTIFEKIKNFISDLVVKFKGTDQEKQLRQLQRTFEKAYKAQGTQTSTETKYLFTRATDEQTAKAEELEKQGLSPEEILIETGAIRGADNMWRSEISDKKSTISEKVRGDSWESNQASRRKGELEKKIEYHEKRFQKNMLKDADVLQREQDFIDKYKIELTEVNEMLEEAKVNLNFATLFNTRNNFKRSYKLNEILQHDELFEVYPEFKDVNIIMPIDKNTDDSTLAYVNEGDTTNIHLTASGLKNIDDLKSTLLHEIQHLIQHKEGFSGGADPAGWYRYKRDEINKKISNLHNEIADKLGDNYFDTYTNIKLNDLQSTFLKIEKNKDEISKYNAALEKEDGWGYRYQAMKETTQIEMQKAQIEFEMLENELKATIGEDKLNEYKSYLEELKDFTNGRGSKAYELYKNTAGEIEAREVQNRIDYTAKQRKEIAPFIKDENTVYADFETDSNAKYSLSTTDNQGRTLTKEQQEYFKDSKVRDEKGNLLTVYHGTKQDFTVFENKLMGKNAGNALGEGYYFTSHKADAEMYKNLNNTDNKGKVLETYIDIKNPLNKSTYNADEMIAKVDEIVSIVEPTRNQNDEFYRYHRDYVEGKLNSFTGFIDYVKGFATVQDTTSSEIFSKLGYDGIIDGNEYVVFNSNQVKNIDNTNPTTNPDIRYSLTPEYGMTHRPSTDYGDASNFEENMPDVFEHPNWYMFGGDDWYKKAYRESLEALRKVRGNPDGEITIYRATIGDTFNEGDWVSPSKTYAENHNYAYLDGKGKVISLKVKAKDIRFAGDDLNEFGYFPNGVEEYSLSAENEEVAPTGNWHVKGEDIKLQIEEVIAPLQETISNLTEQVKTMQESFAPTNQDIVEKQGQEAFNTLTDEQAPSFEDTVFEAMDSGDFDYSSTEHIPSLLESRDIDEVGDRKVKAYQYENPEVKPFFQEEAQNMLYDLDNTIKGERGAAIDELGNYEYYGITRQTTEAIAYLKDNYGYSYDQIRQGLNKIIEDDGKENNAVSKRIEFMLDERLREGYTTSDGIPIPANEDYISFLNEKQVTEYNKEAFNAITDEDVPMYERIEPSQSPVTRENVASQQTTSMKVKTVQNGNTELTDTSAKTQQEKRVAKIMTEAPTPQNRKQRQWAKFVMNFVSKGSPFEDLSLKTNNRELMGKWDSMLTSAAKAQHTMLNGIRKIDAKNNVEEQVSKSLDDIRTKVVNSGKVQEFYEYMYHALNVDRMSLEKNAQAKMAQIKEITLKEYDNETIEKLSRRRITDKTDERTAKLIETAKEYTRLSEVKNKPVYGDSITAEESQKAVEEFEMANPEFTEWASDVYQYNNALRDLMVENNIISQETADLFAEMYPHYVPIKRVDTKGNAINVPLDTNRTGVNTPIKRAKGGDQDILPMFDTMAGRTLQTYKAISKNNFGIELKNTLNSTVDNQQTNLDEILDNVDQQENLLQEGKDGQAPTFTVFENGNKVTYEITQDMYDALKPISDSSLLSTTIKPANFISNFHRGVLTEYNPVFMLTNALKDSQDILMNSQHAAKTYAKLGESYAQILKKGMWYREYMANGGDQNSYFDSQDNTYGKESVADKILPLKAISKINNIIELSPRLAEYIASRESGRSIEVSMLDAARVTTNFKDGGNVTKWLNRNGATFLNASVQGVAQQVRNVREAHANGLKGYANLATKFALAGLPAMILNGLLWEDDEDYEELSDYVKTNYWIVGKYGDGNFIRIPKGRMITVIQESFNQMKHLITGDEQADLNSFLEVLGNNIAPNNPVSDNILSPIVQAVTNKTWYGGDLVPTRLQDVPAEEQYDESIDRLSVALGQATGISPYKINYVLDQYSGGIGDVFLPMMTPQAEGGKDDLASNLLAPLVNKFTVDSTMKNQSVSDLYELSDKLTVNANSSKATDEDILKNKFVDSVKAGMNELYKKKREIQSSDLPDSEKYEQVRNIQKQINDMAKAATRDYEDMDMRSNYADVGGIEYYKDNEGKWKKVNYENEGADLNEMNMSVSEKNTYFKTKMEISEIVGDYKDSKDAITTYDEDSDEYKEALENLSDEKKTKIIDTMLSTDLPDEQKAYLYGRYFSSEKTLEKITNAGVAFDDYLTFSKDTLSIETTEEKVEHLYNSNLSDNTKTVLYETSVLTGFDNEEKYKDYKAVKAAGIDINSWLSYKKQEFVADKDSSGKSISGSRKDKIINYVNSLNLSKAQKAIIIRTEYSSFKDYNVQIVQYLDSLEMPYDDFVSTLESLDMTVKDGYVYWD